MTRDAAVALALPAVQPAPPAAVSSSETVMVELTGAVTPKQITVTEPVGVLMAAGEAGGRSVGNSTQASAVCPIAQHAIDLSGCH